MTGLDKGILAYETTLNSEAQQRIEEIGRADVVVGIPSHRNGRTIGDVVRIVADGIAAYLPHLRVVLMNADGGSSDNTARHVKETPVSPNVEKLAVIYEGVMGKGTGVRAIFEAAGLLDAKACLIVEARAPGLTPEWIPALVNPVLNGLELAVGCYQRSPYAAALSDNLLFPFMRACFNSDLREPLSHEFCLAGPLAAELAGRDVWETDVARFGINAWLTFQMVAERRHIAQVNLGYRGDQSGDPGMPLDQRILHTASTLFRLLSIHRRLWQQEAPLMPIPFQGMTCPEQPIPCRDCADALWDAFLDGAREYNSAWREILSEETLHAIARVAEQPRETCEFPLDLWIRTTIEFVVVYNKGEGDPDRVVDAFLPLFYGRAASYVRQTQGLSLAEREREVEKIVRAFAESRSALIAYWNSYQPWIDASEHWFI